MWTAAGRRCLLWTRLDYRRTLDYLRLGDTRQLCIVRVVLLDRDEADYPSSGLLTLNGAERPVDGLTPNWPCSGRHYNAYEFAWSVLE